MTHITDYMFTNYVITCLLHDLYIYGIYIFFKFLFFRKLSVSYIYGTLSIMVYNSKFVIYSTGKKCLEFFYHDFYFKSFKFLFHVCVQNICHLHVILNYCIFYKYGINYDKCNKQNHNFKSVVHISFLLQTFDFSECVYDIPFY